jgi:hypothetical protein
MAFHAHRAFLPIGWGRDRLQGKIGGPGPQGAHFGCNEHLSFFSERLMPYEFPLDVADETI